MSWYAPSSKNMYILVMEERGEVGVILALLGGVANSTTLFMIGTDNYC